MAAKYGYIGNNPDNSPIVLGRQINAPTGVTTSFVFSSGYNVGYLDIYVNGARLIEGQDFYATDGLNITLVSPASEGDIIEFIAYKSFDLGNVTDAPNNFSVGGNLTVSGSTVVSGGINGTNAYFTGIVTSNQFVGDINGNVTGNVVGNVTGDATGLSGNPNIVVGFTTVNNDLLVQGNLTVNGSQTVFNTSTIEVEDINIGIASASPKLNDSQIDGAGLTIYSSDGDKTLVWENANSRMAFNSHLYAPRVSVANSVTATDYYGDGSRLTNILRGIELLNYGATTGAGITSINIVGFGITAVTSGSASTITLSPVFNPISYIFS